MKFIISIILACVILNTKSETLSNSKWICKVSDTCVDTIKFTKNNEVDFYSCELNYTFKGSYKIKRGIIVLTEKDDSHDEDGGKVTFFRLKFNLKENVLYPISNEELVNEKWQEAKMRIDKNYIFRRVLK